MATVSASSYLLPRLLTETHGTRIRDQISNIVTRDSAYNSHAIHSCLQSLYDHRYSDVAMWSNRGWGLVRAIYLHYTTPRSQCILRSRLNEKPFI